MEEPVALPRGIRRLGCWGISMLCVFGLGALIPLTFILTRLGAPNLVFWVPDRLSGAPRVTYPAARPLEALPALGFLGLWLGVGWGMLLAVLGATRGRWESNGPKLVFTSSTRSFAVPAACVGLGFALIWVGAAAAGQPVTLNDRLLSPEEVYAGGIIVSALTGVISYALYGGITRLTFDLAQRSYRIASGIRPWTKVIEGPIEDIDRLQIDSQTDSESGTWWRVSLVWKDTAREAFSFNRMLDQQEAYQACERLAARLGLPPC